MCKKTIAVFSKHSDALISKLSQLIPSLSYIQVQPSDPSSLKDTEIILGDYDLIGPYIYDLPKIKWIQGTWAGLDSLWSHIKAEDPPKFPITRTSGDNFGQLMGEYVIGNIIFWERNYFQVKQNQEMRLWDPAACPHDHRSLRELTIGILGIGAIGNIIAQTLKHFGSIVYGFGRRETLSPTNKHIDKYFTQQSLPELLGSVDYIVNVLPNTSETQNLLGKRMLKNCKNGKDVVFINIGRGSIIEEFELVEALKAKWISGAILDVFEIEPLPKTSCLWSYSNVFITPHISGNSRVQDVAEKFKINWERYLRNEPLRNQINFKKGY
ncbi:glyoxylate/hydroxypyruvate reductase A-like [Euwallacea similis]|uniref:glyoxylate/hydroxypyruvate reductase A-like n=1 Tax=Euwallacea similis TaxID=1736056 RepID=UPI00344B9FE0